MKKFLLIFLMLSLSAWANDKKIAGITVPGIMKADKNKLVLNGAGVRDKFFVDVYVGALYLKEKSKNIAQILNANDPMAVRLHIVSGLITPEKMSKNTRNGFKKSTKGNITPIKNQINKFINVFQNGIKKFDVYDMIYIPGKGVKVYKNGKFKVTAKGLDFKKALFGIWIGNDPIQNDLKEGMLGM